MRVPREFETLRFHAVLDGSNQLYDDVAAQESTCSFKLHRSGAAVTSVIIMKGGRHYYPDYSATTSTVSEWLPDSTFHDCGRRHGSITKDVRLATSNLSTVTL